MAKRRGEIEDGNINGYVKVRKPRMKWNDDLHQSFLYVVAILGGEDCVPDVSENNEKKKQVLDKFNDVLDHAAPLRRQITEVTVEYTLENHQPPILESNNIVVTVHMPGEEGQRPHAYLIFRELVNPSTTQAKSKGKEKMLEKTTAQLQSSLRRSW